MRTGDRAALAAVVVDHVRLRCSCDRVQDICEDDAGVTGHLPRGRGGYR